MDFKSLTYTTFNELRTTSGVDGSSVKVLGKAVDNDGFGGIFYWDNSSVLPDDNLNVIQKTGLLQGRWRRLMFPGGGGTGSYVGGPGIDIVGNVISNSVYLDDIVSTNFDTSTGDFILTTRGGVDIISNLDGRYLTSSADVQTLSWDSSSAELSISNGNTVQLTGLLTLSALSATAPITYDNTTGTFSISQAGPTADGYLSATDWNSFNNKQDSLGYVPENEANKVVDFNSPNNTTYPTTQAIVDYIDDISTGGTVTSVAMTVPEGFVVVGTPITTAGTLALGYASGYTYTKFDEKVNWNSAYNNNIQQVSFDTATGDLDFLRRIGTIFTVNLDGRYLLSSDLDDYYTKTELQTSGDAEVHWDNITNAPGFLELSSLSASSPIVYNSSTGNFSISQAGATTDGYLSSQDWNTFNNKADAFSTGNIVAGTGVTFTGSGSNRLFGSGNLTIEVEPVDLSGYVPTSRTLTINGTTYDLSDDRTWTIPVADGSETKINAGTGVTVTGSGTTGNPYVISSPYQTLSWNNTTKTISISNGNSQVLSGLVSSDVSITNSYGINIGGDLDTGLSIGLDTTVVDLRYLRKDVDDSNGANKLTLGELEAGDTEITGTLTLGSVASGPMTNNFLTIDPSTGEVEQTPLSVEIPDLVIADGSGVTQFEVDLASENLKFVGTGDTAVSFNAATNTITINSVPGQGGGGSVTSFNGRDGAVVSITGDYNTSQVTETTNLYFTEPRVLSTVLTGFTPTFGTVTSTDTVLSAFEKLQSQLDYKVGINTTLTVNGTAGRVIVSGGTQSLNANRVWTVDLANAGTAGTYTKVTTDAYGRVTSGTTLQTSDLPISAGSGIDISPTGVISNTAQDQAISITGTGLTTVTGTYPSFTVDTTLIAGPGIDITGNTISSTATTPNLQQVTNVGNTTTNNIIVGSSTNNTKISALNVDIGTYDPTSTWSRSHSVTRYASGEPTHLVSFGAYGPSSGINYGYISSKLVTPYSAADIKFIDGKVGINLSSDTVPAYNLEVIGNARISSIGNAAGDFVTANSTGVLSRRTAAQALSDMGGVSSSRNIVAGNGLTGGGTLASDVTLTIGTPGSITATSTNEVTATSHTHELAANAVTTAKILNSNVTFAKIQNIPTQTLIGRYSAGTGVAQSITLGTGLNLNSSGVLSATNTASGTVTSVSSTVGGTALSVAVTNPTTTPNLAFDWEGTTSQYVTGAGTLVTFPAIPQGTVTSITIGNGLTGSSPITSTGTITLGTPGAVTLSSTNSVTASSHTHAFTPGGTTSQYIRGDGTLATFPTLPTVNNGTLTLGTSGIATGSATFTANQSGNSSFTVNVPGTNLGSSLSGNNLTITSSTGANTTVDLSGLTSVTPNLQQVTDVNNVTDNALRVTGFTNPSGATAGMILSYDATSQTSSVKHNGTTVFQSDNISVGVIAPDNPITGIVVTGDVVQLLANGTASFGLVGTSGNELALFNTRVQGLDAVNSNEFVTLGQLPDVSGFVPNTRTITAGNGLTGGGNLTANRTITLGTPGTITLGSTNTVTTSSHTHAFAPGGTTAQYIRGDGSLATFPSIPSPYVLPVATATTLGGIELFSNTVQTVAANAVTSTASRTYGIQLNSAGQAVVNVPWTDNNTTYSGSNSIELVGTNIRRAALGGDVTAPANSNTLTIANGAVTTDKIANGAVTNDKVTSVDWTKITGAPGFLTTETDPVYTASIPDQMMLKSLIPGIADLNDYTTTGIYHQNTNAGASSGANYPAPYAGVLEVKNNGTSTFTYQTYTTYNGSSTGSYNNVFVRTNYNGSWSSWRKLLQSTDIPSTPTLQQVTTAGNTSTNSVSIGASIAPTAPLTVIGNNASTEPIAHFRTTSANTVNNGLFVRNTTSTSGQIIPTISGASNHGTYGMFLESFSATSNGGLGSMLFRTYGGGYGSATALTSGTSFSFRNAGDELFSLSYNGQATLSNLAGSGNRMVYVTPAGVLGATTMPVSGVTSVSAGNGMNFTTITGTGAVTMGTPSPITSTSTNSVTSTSHTHELAPNAVTTAKIANNAVTLVKLEDLDQYEFIGRYSSGTGDPQKLKLGSGFDVDTTTGVVDVSGGGGGWVDEMGYDYEGNADNLSKGLDTRGGYATRPFVFINNSTIPDDVETCIFIGDKATLTIPDPALYENRVISIINRGGANLDLAGYLPIINVHASATIDELISYYPGVATGNGANSLEIQSIYNPITSTYIWVVLHFHFSDV